MADASSSPLLAASGASQASFADRADPRSRAIFVAVAILFFGATLASVDVAYNIATYTYVGSEFFQNKNASWLLIAHEIVHSVVQPIFGSLSNLYGLKRMTLLAYGLFAFGAILCGISTGFAQVIIGRLITSIGVSGIAVLVTFTLSSMVSVRTFAILQSCHSICETVGLVVGGLLGTHVAKPYGWRLMYSINGLLSLLLIFGLSFAIPSMALPMLEADSEHASSSSWHKRLTKFDFIGAASLILAVSSMILALELGAQSSRWPTIVAFGALSLLTAVFFFLFESRRSENMLIPLSLLKSPDVQLVVACNSITMLAYTMSLYQLSFYLQVLQYSDKDTTYFGLVPLYVGLGGGFLVSGLYVRATGNARAAIISSSACAALCYALLASVYVDVGLRWHEPLLFCLGISLATSFESLVVLLVSKSDKKKNALLIGMNSVAVSISGTFGTKASATMLSRSLTSTILSNIKDPGLAKEVLSKIFKSLEELGTLKPDTQEIVVQSLQEVYRGGHVYICGIAILTIMISLCLNGLGLKK